MQSCYQDSQGWPTAAPLNRRCANQAYCQDAMKSKLRGATAPTYTSQQKRSPAVCPPNSTSPTFRGSVLQASSVFTENPGEILGSSLHCQETAPISCRLNLADASASKTSGLALPLSTSARAHRLNGKKSTGLFHLVAERAEGT